VSTRSTAPISTEDAYVEVQPRTGGDFQSVPGVSGISESGGDSPTRETRTFAAVFTHTGNASPVQISISLNAFVPVHPTIKLIKDAHKDNDSLNFRYTFRGRIVKPSAGASNTAAIAANGVVTFVDGTVTAPINNESFTREDVGPGMSIKIGNTHYIISAISDTGQVTVVSSATLRPLTAPVAAAPFTVEQPAIRRPSFSCRIMNTGNIDAQVDSDLTTTLELQPISILPDWELV